MSPRHIGDNNITRHLIEIECYSLAYIQLAQDRIQGQAFVNSLGNIKGVKHLKYQLSKKGSSMSWPLSFQSA